MCVAAGVGDVGKEGVFTLINRVSKSIKSWKRLNGFQSNVERLMDVVPKKGGEILTYIFIYLKATFVWLKGRGKLYLAKLIFNGYL